MTDRRIPDPTLMARIEMSAQGVDWAVSLSRHRQHERPGGEWGEWSPHQVVYHMLATERAVFLGRMKRIIDEDRPSFLDWDGDADMRDHYTTDKDVSQLAAEFMAERERTLAFLRSLTPEQWARRAFRPDGREVDVAWFAERSVAHAILHFSDLLYLHTEFEPFIAAQWQR